MGEKKEREKSVRKVSGVEMENDKWWRRQKQFFSLSSLDTSWKKQRNLMKFNQLASSGGSTQLRASTIYWAHFVIRQIVSRTRRLNATHSIVIKSNINVFFSHSLDLSFARFNLRKRFRPKGLPRTFFVSFPESLKRGRSRWCWKGRKNFCRQHFLMGNVLIFQKSKRRSRSHGHKTYIILVRYDVRRRKIKRSELIVKASVCSTVCLSR